MISIRSLIYHVMSFCLTGNIALGCIDCKLQTMLRISRYLGPVLDSDEVQQNIKSQISTLPPVHCAVSSSEHRHDDGFVEPFSPLTSSSYCVSPLIGCSLSRDPMLHCDWSRSAPRAAPRTSDPRRSPSTGRRAASPSWTCPGRTPASARTPGQWRWRLAIFGGG